MVWHDDLNRTTFGNVSRRPPRPFDTENSNSIQTWVYVFGVFSFLCFDYVYTFGLLVVGSPKHTDTQTWRGSSVYQCGGGKTEVKCTYAHVVVHPPRLVHPN